MKKMYVVTLCCLCSCVSSVSLTTGETLLTGDPLPFMTMNGQAKREFDVAYDKVLETILIMLQEEKCFIKGADKQCGIITAKQYIPTNNPFVFKTGENKNMSFLLIKKENGKTEVRLTIYLDEVYRAETKNGYIYSRNEKGLLIEKEVYRVWFDKLTERLGF
ncbi:hypothetical protein [Parabacteroides pacaensis]|uniref:hypothetical protein n=1 Tax=Parabacteroides pacaensis TaxID=2086575 RepID=UPI00131DB61B|nr:hypothetical protein [Parabacteroides pacaensis]